MLVGSRACAQARTRSSSGEASAWARELKGVSNAEVGGCEGRLGDDRRSDGRHVAELGKDSMHEDFVLELRGVDEGLHKRSASLLTAF